MALRTPHRLRREVDALLGRLDLDDDCPPRTLAVVLALQHGLDARAALDRLGLDTAPLDAPAPAPFGALPPGATFTHAGRLWTKSSLDDAFHLVSDVRARRRLIGAYVNATADGIGLANAFSSDSGLLDGFVVDRFDDDDVVRPAADAGAYLQDGGP